MVTGKHIINDLLHENKVNFAKFEQLKKVKKDEINKLFECVNIVAECDFNDIVNYLKQCSNLFDSVFSVVKLVRQQKDLLDDIKSNLKEIERIKLNGADKKAN